MVGGVLVLCVVWLCVCLIFVVLCLGCWLLVFCFYILSCVVLWSWFWVGAFCVLGAFDTGNPVQNVGVAGFCSLGCFSGGWCAIVWVFGYLSVCWFVSCHDCW